MISTIFGRARQFNPFPTICHLPGDLSKPHLPAIAGVVKQNIVHALTYHEVPPNIDFQITLLPQEAELQVLDPLKRQYLSFLVS